MNNKETNNNKKRCSFPNCKKKLKLTDQFPCRCELLFCTIHKMPESHNCKYNYKSDKIKLVKLVTPKIENKI